MPFYVTCPLFSLMLTRLPTGQIKPTTAFRWPIIELKTRHKARACSDHCFKIGARPPLLLRSWIIVKKKKKVMKRIHTLLMGKNNIIEKWPGFTRKILGSGSSGLVTYSQQIENAQPHAWHSWVLNKWGQLVPFSRLHLMSAPHTLALAMGPW